jgi:signal transduction histidine kinase
LASALSSVDEEMREALGDTIVSCDGLAHIIDNMEILAHALSGREGLARSRLDLVPLLTEVVSRHQALAKSHALELVLEPPASAPAYVEAHRDMLGRALGNLVRNSIQHGGAGSVVRVSLGREGSEYVVRIVDEGMPLSEQLRLDGFTARGQLVAKSARGGRYSRGLGLFSARVAADACGARVRTSTLTERVSSFELLMPIAD